MTRAKVINFPGSFGSKVKKKGNRLNARNPGRVYGRGGKLWVDFYYLKERVREPSGLDDTPENQVLLRKMLNFIMAEIETGVFVFAKRFPHSKKAEYFTALEGRTFRKEPREVLFGEYVEKWWKEMRPGMSESQVRDYSCILRTHLIPYFAKLPFSEFKPVLMKKFLAHLIDKRTPGGTALSSKRIHNILIPLRVIVKDAMDEYGWSDLPSPFSGLKLPKVRRMRIHPFTFEEWAMLMKFIPALYQPYFELAVQTGLRPSEQVALKWSAIDDRFIHVELSRVRNQEKINLKTLGSQRRIEIRLSIRKTLEAQKRLLSGNQNSYVFLNMLGRPVNQVSLRWVWVSAMEKSGLPFRRMYEVRHTFASWALFAGETPEWVARTLGHVDTSMVFRTYGRYIPNLTRQDGSALENLMVGALKSNLNRHNHGHNGPFSGC